MHKISRMQIHDSTNTQHHSTEVAGQGQDEKRYFVQCTFFSHPRYYSLEGDTACR